MESEKLTDSLKQALIKERGDTSKINILYRLAIAFSDNDSATALQYANTCLQYSQQNNWQKGIGLGNYALARIYYNLSKYDIAMEHAKKSYAIFKSLDNKKLMASASDNIGSDYQGSGLYTQSLENYLSALKLFEETNNNNGLSVEYGNIGIDYYNLLQYDKAISSYKKALSIDQVAGDEFGMASDVDNIAIVYLDEMKYDSANVYNLKAMKLFEHVKDSAALGRIYINRGNILMHLYNAQSAYEFYKRSMAINTKLGITVALAADNRAFGNLYLELAKDTSLKYKIATFMKMNKTALLIKAKNYLMQALVLGKISNDFSRMMDYTNLLSETEELLGNYKSSLAYYKGYTSYKDSIFNDENRSKIEAMETERLAEVKDQQIHLLNQQKALATSELKRESLKRNIIITSVIIIAVLTFVFIFLYNRRRKVQFDNRVMNVEMKALRTQMNPHFIFNSLHSINNYVMENDKQNASAYLLKFASLMRFILESSREQEVPVETDLQALELYMQLEALQSKKTFSYKIETDAHINRANTLIPPMLLQPFVENAILHGIKYKEDGFIKIKVRKENEMICFEIEDNGSGIKESTVTPQQNKKHKSLGKKIVDERIDIINRLQKAKASVQTFNLTNNDTINGVKVKLLLPLKLAF